MNELGYKGQIEKITETFKSYKFLREKYIEKDKDIDEKRKKVKFVRFDIAVFMLYGS